eukprot:scaffold13449_cov188-Amphora_coffeaeformis.AAC.1
MRVKPTFRILCVNRLVWASCAKTKLPRLHIQFRQHRVLIVPQTIECGLILVLFWVMLMRINIYFLVMLTRIDIHAHVGAHTARERNLMTRTRDTPLRVWTIRGSIGRLSFPDPREDSLSLGCARNATILQQWLHGHDDKTGHSNVFPT